MHTQSHDITLFSQMVDILVSSALGEKDYGFRKLNTRYNQTRYEDLAMVMNREGLTNRQGNPITRNTLKQTVHRVRQKKDIIDQMKPDWSDFQFIVTTETSHTGGCLVCGAGVPRKNRKTCSSECGGIYQQHKNAPCDPKFPSIFHQMRREESFYKKTTKT